jgi:hypothetical protein
MINSRTTKPYIPSFLTWKEAPNLNKNVRCPSGYFYLKLDTSIQEGTVWLMTAVIIVELQTKFKKEILFKLRHFTVAKIEQMTN